jgi:hypothetical protein
MEDNAIQLNLAQMEIKPRLCYQVWMNHDAWYTNRLSLENFRQEGKATRNRVQLETDQYDIVRCYTIKRK